MIDHTRSIALTAVVTLLATAMTRFHQNTGVAEAALECSWREMSDAVFAQRPAVCEYTGPLALRVIDDSIIFIAIGHCADDARHGFCSISVWTNGDAIPPQWAWKTTTGVIRVLPGGLYIASPTDGTPPLAFGRSVDDLSEKFPHAYRIGIKSLMTSFNPHLDFETFASARPSRRCPRDRGFYWCFEAGGRAFNVR